MFGRIRNRGISLAISGRQLQAASVPEFEVALSALTGVSAQRIEELGALDDRALSHNDQVLGRLIEQLSGSLNTDAEISEFAKRIQSLGGVHRPWSEALVIASQWQDHQLPFRLSLLKAYVQFLRNEQMCMHTLQTNRQRRQPDSGHSQGSSRRQQLIFTPHDLGLDPRTNGELALARLGKGNVVEIPIQPGQSLTLMLSRHLFVLVCGEPWLLIDSHGEDLQLKPGRNLVGRSNDCDVVINERYFAVSRRHALVETETTQALKITDLSSLGTFVPQHGLDNHLH